MNWIFLLLGIGFLLVAIALYLSYRITRSGFDLLFLIVFLVIAIYDLYVAFSYGTSNIPF